MERNREAMIEAIKSDPEFHHLVQNRSRLAWTLSALMVLIYFGFILLIAFEKEILARSLMGGITTIGIPVGLGVIVSAFILTGIYVVVANSSYDDRLKRIIDRAKQS